MSKLQWLNKLKLVSKSWHDSVRGRTFLKRFFERLFIEELTTDQLEAIKALFTNVLSDNSEFVDEKSAEKDFLKFVLKQVRNNRIDLLIDFCNNAFTEQLVSETLLLKSVIVIMHNKGASEAVKCMLKLGNEIENDNGSTRLHMAIEQSERALVRLLLEQCKDVDVNAQDSYGETGLHLLARHGHAEEMVLLLFAHAANANIQNNYGDTPLHLAALYGHLTTVEMLLRNNANKSAWDKNGLTPYDLASLFGREDVAQLLVK